MSATLFEPKADARPPPPPATQGPVQERDYISFSAIRSYQTCPLRYFFKYVAGLPEDTVSSSLIFGSAIHRAVEHHFRCLLEGQEPPNAKELLAEYRIGWKDRTNLVRFGKDEDVNTLDTLADRMLKAFATSDLAKPAGTIVAVEETLRGPIIPGLPDVLGRVDLILETAEELVISDWKTSRAKYSEDQVQDSTEQLLLYSELARDFAPGKKVRLEFAVLTKTKETSIERHSAMADPLRVDRTKRIVERVFRSIEAGHFYPAPSMMNCPGCPFKDPCRKWPG
jgi:CRISPR/Cas system-associated exonuclease Cas4 (RecB family)